jgi:phosphonate transport system ATP-binding protein
MRYCPRVVALRRGKVVYDGPSADLTAAMLRELYGSELNELMPAGETVEPTAPAALDGRAVVAAQLAAA